jgi:hypothetical protein
MSKSAKSKNPAKDKTTSKVGQELARDKQRKRAIEFTCDSRSVSDRRGQLGRECVVGYIQSVSPPKQSRKNTEYSNFKLQAKSGLVLGVCFSSTKRSILAEHEATKTAVKLDTRLLLHVGRENDLCQRYYKDICAKFIRLRLSVCRQRYPAKRSTIYHKKFDGHGFGRLRRKSNCKKMQSYK